jgi:hypothetical protein
MLLVVGFVVCFVAMPFAGNLQQIIALQNKKNCAIVVD